jgi:hypothetical protein
VTVATKFGIPVSGGGARLGRLQAPARWLLGRSPRLRQRVKREADARVVHDFRPETARASLETSLRELGTDHVDILFLHGPSPDAVVTDELCAYLEQAREAGQILAWGVSGDAQTGTRLADGWPVPTVLQVQHDVFDAGGPAVERAAALYGVLAKPMQRISALLEGDPARAGEWARAVGADCRDRGVLARLLLRDAVDRHPDKLVLFSSTRPANVAGAVRAALEPGGDEPSLAAFRACVHEAVAAGC